MGGGRLAEAARAVGVETDAGGEDGMGWDGIHTVNGCVLHRNARYGFDIFEFERSPFLQPQ